MKKIIKEVINSALKPLDLKIIRSSTIDKLSFNASAVNDINFLLGLPSDKVANVIKYFSKSKSQLRQDLFVLASLNFKANGFFVEFGATNGIHLSNTYLLEKVFSWNGILAEPAKCWHKDLKENRACSIETACVWSDSNSIVDFIEVDAAELSTVSSFTELDSHKKIRNHRKKYNVKTISLYDLLEKYNAPKIIDYLSIDTEGSEYEILRNFDFTKYTFNIISCEHNFTPMREKIFNLLSNHGYARVHQELSRFDDWYINLAQIQNQ
ncbi:FkbM family methyltransferase [Polynucleobacter sp.]|uniref:FkbM family methyltransferase n=1 Tax=Polynucleobacter sp. TaxID=2029855 RepID=UPI003F6957BD